MLNAEQQRAVDSNARKILCKASAGSGKTRILIERITRLVKEGVNPSDILALTFTNNSAFEMRERFKKANPDKQSPMFCTFHSFCYRLIAEDARVRAAMGYSTIPEIADEKTIKRLETEVKQQLGTKLSGAKLSGKSPLTANEKFDYDIYWKNYRKKLIIANLITFDTLCWEVCDLFINNLKIVETYKEQYKHIVVDEFQDTGTDLWLFVRSFNQSNLFVVGDENQAIYQFRGGDSSIIKSLAVNPDWEVITLFRNYRSTKQICSYANNIYGDNTSLIMQSERDGCEVITVEPPSLTEAVQYVLHEGSDTQERSTAILCRSNAEADSVKQILDSRNIPYNTNKADNSAVDLLRSVDDLEYRLGWLSSKLDAAQYTQWIRLCAVDRSFRTWDAFAYHYGDDWRIKKDIERLRQIEYLMSDSSLPYERARSIITFLTGKEIPGFGSFTGSDLADDESTLKFCADYCTSCPESNLYIGTIHSSKGLEYDIVHVLGVGSPSFKIDGEEMLNLFYVAVTRCRNELYVYRRCDYYG